MNKFFFNGTPCYCFLIEIMKRIHFLNKPFWNYKNNAKKGILADIRKHPDYEIKYKDISITGLKKMVHRHYH